MYLREPLAMLVRLKRLVEGWLTGVAKRLLNLGLKANQATVFGFILAVASALLFYLGLGSWPLTVAASLLLLCSGLFDALDGVMARLSGGGTRLGSLLDSVLDRYADGMVIVGITLAYSGLSLLGVPMVFWGSAALLGSLLVSYVRAKGESLGLSLAGVGLAERPERILILAGSGLLGRPDVGLLLVAFASNLTALQRFGSLLARLRGHG
ncbi:MAG: CDP-alcohol phosphatidyltransferase family protein [Candidatus Hecatellales archaeon]|nr:MAG: CDP-alcohol phosphatidyltransferase family protein [Candidatus Hecatellales archaeon]